MTKGLEAGTVVYVDASTGEVTARRNDLWRIYHFLWSLHIRDDNVVAFRSFVTLRGARPGAWLGAMREAKTLPPRDGERQQHESSEARRRAGSSSAATAAFVAGSCRSCTAASRVWPEPAGS